MAAKLRARKLPAVAIGQLNCCVMDPACAVRKDCQQADGSACNGSCAKDAEPGRDAYTAEELAWPASLTATSSRRRPGGL